MAFKMYPAASVLWVLEIGVCRATVTTVLLAVAS